MEAKMELSVPDYCKLKNLAYMLSATMESTGATRWMEYRDPERVDAVLVAIEWTADSIVDLVEKMQHVMPPAPTSGVNGSTTESGSEEEAM